MRLCTISFFKIFSLNIKCNDQSLLLKNIINIIFNQFFHNLSCLLSKKNLIKIYFIGVDLENASLQYIYNECLQILF